MGQVGGGAGLGNITNITKNGRGLLEVGGAGHKEYHISLQIYGKGHFERERERKIKD